MYPMLSYMSNGRSEAEINVRVLSESCHFESPAHNIAKATYHRKQK